jgi:YidC/Oxa1 family membrane protein insertase
MEQNDQRNMMLAIVLMVVLMFGYSTFVLEPQARSERAARARAAAEQVQSAATQAPKVERQRDELVAEDLATAARVPVDGGAIDGSISLKGGRIDDISLKGFYETIEDKLDERPAGEIQLLSPEQTGRPFFAEMYWKSPSGVTTRDSVWTQTSNGALTPENPLDLQLTLQAGRIDRRVSIDENYMFTIADTFTNTSAETITITPETFVRQKMLPDLLKIAPQDQQAHKGVLGTYGSKKNQMVKYTDLNKGKGVVEEVSSGWIALTTKYWMAAAIPDQTEAVTMRAMVEKANGDTIFEAGFTGTARSIAPGAAAQATSRIFAGAKRVSVLEAYQKTDGIPDFTDAVDWSWLWFITKPFFWMLQTFQNWFGSFGLAILAVTVVVKTAFFPVQMKVYESMSKLRKLQPEMEDIRKRFEADKTRQQQEIMKLYQREKANPLAGCLPLIPQAFVFYALYHTLMVSLEMRHTPFYGWIKDMSAPDPTTIFNLFGLLPWDPSALPLIGGFLMIGIWPILYGLTMWALQGMSAPPTDPTQKMIMQFLPLVFLFLFAGFAAGLVIYWVWSNAITMVQQYVIMRRNGVETEFDKLIKRLLKRPAGTS